jgi:peptide/nickel transport system substrate-binding protein
MAELDSRLARDLTRRDVLVGAGVLGAGAVLAACGKTERTGGGRQQGGTLVVGAEAIGENFVPPAIFGGWGHMIALANIYDTLYTFEGRDVTKPLVPWLATALPTASKDGLVQTVDLRKNVKFHDGTPFNAEAVEFNYMRYLDKDHAYFDPNVVYIPTYALAGVEKVEAIDELRVRFTLNRPIGDFPRELTAVAGFMSPAAVKKAGVESAGLSPVGTGPFKFVEAKKGDSVTLEAFDGYWHGRPAIDRLVIRAIPDASAMAAALLGGEVDVTTFVDYKDVGTFESSPDLTVGVKPSVITGYMYLNAGGSGGIDTFTDVNRRLAACHAINKQQLIEVIFDGHADIGAGWSAVPMPGYQPDLKDYNAYDPDRAKQLLDQAGGGPSIELLAQSSGIWPRMAELLQSDLNAVGFTTRIKTIDSTTFYDAASKGKHHLFLGDATPLKVSADVFHTLFFGCDNPLNLRAGGWCDKRYDRLAGQLLETSEASKRNAIVEQLDVMLLKNGIVQHNYYPRLVTVINNRVKGVAPVQTREMFFDRASVAQ